MTTITFDTLKFAKKLENAGVSKEIAEALAEAQQEAFDEVSGVQDYVTKTDLITALADLRFELIKWMIGLFFAQCALVIGILFKIVH